MKRREFLVSAATVGLGLALSKPLLGKIKEETFTATILQVDTINGNKRIYPKPVIEKSIANFSPMVGELNCNYGKVDSTIDYRNLSHKIDKIYLDNDYLKADITLLNTPQGLILKNLLQEDLVAFIPCGICGEYKLREDGVMIIHDDYKFIKIDAVFKSEAASFYFLNPS